MKEQQTKDNNGFRKEFMIDVLCSAEYHEARKKKGFPYNTNEKCETCGSEDCLEMMGGC